MDTASVLQALRRGDEAVFERLVEAYHASMLRLARVYVSSQAVAEEVVQETWLAMIEGIDRFEGRSTIKTWLFAILTNKAKSRGQREGRIVPFSSAFDAAQGPPEPAVSPDRFGGDASSPSPWTSPPTPWHDVPDDAVLSKELREVIDEAIAALPAAQQEVITLRDVEGFRSEQACEILGISEGNQRVLLHRARSKVRGAVERYVTEAT